MHKSEEPTNEEIYRSVVASAFDFHIQKEADSHQVSVSAHFNEACFTRAQALRTVLGLASDNDPELRQAIDDLVRIRLHERLEAVIDTYTQQGKDQFLRAMGVYLADVTQLLFDKRDLLTVNVLVGLVGLNDVALAAATNNVGDPFRATIHHIEYNQRLQQAIHQHFEETQ